jgi:hypothetical protein
MRRGWSRINPGLHPAAGAQTPGPADAVAMNIYDYLLNGALVALVVLQIRGRRMTIRELALPLAVVTVVAFAYLHSVPTVGNDLALVVSGAVTGLLLGTGCGLATAVYLRADGARMAKAGALAAVLWVAGVGARMAFALYATHGGGRQIGQFSIEHQITPHAWVACLILMALTEVVSRSAVLAGKYMALGRARPAAETAAAVRAGLS